MNSLDFTGPIFLVFYAACGAAACAGLRWLNWASEPHTPTRPAPTDPQTIAYLRGGATETLRVTAVTLLEQGVLLLGPKDTLQVSAKNGLPACASVVDRAVCEHFGSGDDARSLFRDEGLAASARSHAERELEHAGLIPDETLRDARQRRFLAVAVPLGLLAAGKAAVALQRGHTNVGLLLIEAVILAAIAHSVTHRFRTPAGDRALNYLKHSFDAVRQRAQSAHPAAGDIAIVAAVFGLAALPSVPTANVAALQPRQDGSGCGGGCGGDDGCGGCGCG